MVNMRIMCLQQMIMYPINKNKFDGDDKDDNKVGDDKLKDNEGSKYALGQVQLS